MQAQAYQRIAGMPPNVASTKVAEAVREQFGLQGRLVPLISERDQNFLLTTTGGDRFVVKVTSATEPHSVSRFHAEALQHLEHEAAISTPDVVLTSSGRLFGSIGEHDTPLLLRVVSYLDGAQLSTITLTPAVAASFGRQLAALDLALQGFTHEGERPELLWDLQRTPELWGLLHHIDEPVVAARVEIAIADYQRNVHSAIGSMRRQVIHGDANPENVLLDPAGCEVAGFIDFGDALDAPLAFEPAIAASYLRNTMPDPLSLIAPFVAAYNAVLPLADRELGLLFDLVRARLAMTITVMYWRLASRSEGDPYRQKTLQTEAPASDFLAVLDNVGRDAFAGRLRRAIDQE